MRLFIALELDPESRRRLDELLRISQPALSVCGRLTRSENQHVTLLFIGEWPEENLSQLVHLLDLAAARHQPFTLTLDCFGVFGGEKSRRSGDRYQILWLGDSGLAGRYRPSAIRDADRLEVLGLVQELRHEAAKLGIQADTRSFFPHLTITRKLPASLTASVLDALPGFPPIQIRVHHMVLMQSVPQADHMAYRPLHRAELGRDSGSMRTICQL